MATDTFTLSQLSARHHAGSRSHALEGIDLAIRQGEQLAVIGPSGAGKTTLLSVLACAHKPEAGRFEVFGTDPWRLANGERHRLRARLFLAPQVPPLPPRQRVVTAVLAARLPRMGVWQAFSSLLYPSDPAAAFDALSRFNLGDKLYARVDRLSGGERQRCALARLLLSGADAFLVDEPLSALDPATSRLALGTLQQEARERNATLVCSLHQVEMAREHFRRLVGLRDGRIVFDLPREQVTDEMVAALYDDDEQPAPPYQPHDTADSIAVGACF